MVVVAKPRLDVMAEDVVLAVSRINLERHSHLSLFSTTIYVAGTLEPDFSLEWAGGVGDPDGRPGLGLHIPCCMDS